jgi:hypothetical protein
LKELDPEDPDFFGDERETARYCTDDTLYVWNVSIVPKHRNHSIFSTLLYPTTIQEAAQNGYKKIVFHSRQSENLTPMYEQKYGARNIRQVDDWFPDLPEEKFDLVEIDLNPETNPKIEETLLLSLKNPTRAEGVRHELDQHLTRLLNYGCVPAGGKFSVPRHPDDVVGEIAREMIKAQNAGVDIAPFQNGAGDPRALRNMATDETACGRPHSDLNYSHQFDARPPNTRERTEASRGIPHPSGGPEE